MKSFVMLGLVLMLAVASAKVIPTIQMPESSPEDLRVGVRVAIGQQLISAALLSVAEPLVYLLDKYQGYLPSINDTEPIGLIDVHLTTNQTRLYNMSIASVYGDWIEDHNSLKVTMAGISGNLDTLYSYHYWSVWTHHGYGSVEAYFYDASGWIEINFGVDGEGHLFLTYVDSHIQLKHLDMKFTGDWSFILNHVPGIHAAIKHRINKKFKEICHFTIHKTDELFGKLPNGLKLPLFFQDAISLSYAMPEAAAVLNSGFASFPIFGHFYPTKFPTLLPPFAVNPILPLTANTPNTALPTFPFPADYEPLPPLKFDLPLPDYITINDQGQIIVSAYSMTSMGWALNDLGALNMNITQKDIPSSFPIVLNTDYFSALIPTIFTFCPNCPIKWVVVSPGYPVITVNASGINLAYTTHVDWYTYQKRKDVWEFAFSMFVDVSGYMFINVDDKKNRIYGELTVAPVDMRMDKSEIGTVHLAPLQSISNRLIDTGLLPIINGFLENVGFPIPPLPLGVRFVNPAVVFQENVMIIETDMHFPFPRSATWENWGGEWMAYQKERAVESQTEEERKKEWESVWAEGERENLVVSITTVGDGGKDDKL